MASNQPAPLQLLTCGEDSALMSIAIRVDVETGGSADEGK
jgi:hypothetical protein